MRHFPSLLRKAAVTLGVISAFSVSAEYQRYPDPGSVAPTDDADLLRMQKNLIDFVNSRNSARQLLQPAPDAPMLRETRQRPVNSLRTAELPKGDIKVVCSRYEGQAEYGQSYYGTLNPLTGKTTPIYRNSAFCNGDSYEIMAGVIRNHILHIPELFYSADGMVTQTAQIRWKRIDLRTGQSIEPFYYNLDEKGMRMFLYSATYVEPEDKIYGLSMDVNTGAAGLLVEIDCSQPQWEAKALGNIGGSSDTEYMVNIVYNPADENLYGFKSNGTFNMIDIEGAEPQCIIMSEYDDWDQFYCYLPAKYSAGICYSPYDNAFIFHQNNPRTGEYTTAALDAETFEAFELSAPSPLAFYPVLYCADSYAPQNAPDRMAAPSVEFLNGSTSGSVSVSAPTTYFNSMAIEGNVTLTILLDGENVHSASYAPGAQANVSLNVGTGLHTVEAFASRDGLDGPKSSTVFYAGYDVPLPPTNLKLANSVLTWDAPAPTGINHSYGGYLDLSDVTYDVYVDGKKINSRPVTTAQYTIDMAVPEVCRQDVAVTATSHGQTSDLSKALNRAFGAGYSLPVEFAPTPEQAELFEIADCNGDSYKFTYYPTQFGNPLFSMRTTDFHHSPDDWLFLPPVYCDSDTSLYELVFTYMSSMKAAGYFDSMDICVGKDPLPEAMGEPFYSHEGREQPTPEQIKARFWVPAAGTYYIGIHSKPAANPITPNKYRGIYVYDLKVSKTDGSKEAPAAPADVVATAAPLGENLVDISVTLPTLDVTGAPLAGGTEITLTAESDSGSASVKGQPGQKVSLTVGTSSNGIITILLTPSSAAGEGRSISTTLYVGLDSPLPPANVKGVMSDDNMSVVLTWDPVGDVGAHGGYVDTGDVDYVIWTQESINENKVANVRQELTYTYTTGAHTQQMINIGPVATNSAGNSVNGIFFSDLFGAPHAMPVVEEFGASAFDYQKWTFNTSAPFDKVLWDHVNDLSSMGVNGLTLVNRGGLAASYSGAGSAQGELRAPKISTRGVHNAEVSVRYLDCAFSADMEFWGRTSANQEYRFLGKLTPQRQSTPQWNEFTCLLPEDFSDKGWIQVNLRGNFENGQAVVIDNYKMVQNIENDFMISDIKLPFRAFVGETTPINVTVINAGKEVNSGSLIVELLGDNEVLQTVSTNIGRTRPNEVFEFQAEFKMLEEYIKYDFMDVRATTACTDDQNESNNVMTLELLLDDSQMPVVRDLKATVAENGKDVDLKWSMPDTEYTGVESFEVSESFTNDDTIDRWTNIDGDGLCPFVIDGKRWTNDDKPCAWQVFDAKTMNTLGDERLSPHSGERMLMARSVQYTTEEDMARSFDWLISPEVKGGSRVTFWLNTMSSTYTETVQIWYSATDNKIDLKNVVCDENGNPQICGSFKKLRNFTKSGDETWELCSYMLPQDAKYFALVYASYGQFAAMVDDITFSPVEPGKVSIDEFDVYVAEGDNEPSIIGNTEKTEFTHTPADMDKAVYYVVGIHKAGSEFIYSPFSNPAKAGASGVDEIEAGKFVGGGKGHVLVGGAEGDLFTLYDLEGRTIIHAVVESDRQRFSCAPGIYTARLGKGAVKIIVR